MIAPASRFLAPNGLFLPPVRANYAEGTHLAAVASADHVQSHYDMRKVLQ